MGLDLDAPGWQRNKGLRIVGAGHRIELPWPDLATFPSYGLVRTRSDLDEILARHAEKAGARVFEGTNVTGPILDDRTGRVIGVLAILVGALTVITPIFHRLSSSEADVAEIDAEMERLRLRISELEAKKASLHAEQPNL